MVPSPAAAESDSPKPTTSIGFDITSDYFIRGINIQTQGLIAQPSLGVAFPVFAGETVGVRVFGGAFSSVHATHSPNAHDPQPWHEANVFGGLAMSIGRWTTSAHHHWIMSPNGTFPTGHVLLFDLAYADGSLFPKRFLGFRPSLRVVQEIGAVGLGSKAGTALVTALKPGITAVDGDAVRIDVSLPVSAGWSLKDYYEVGGMDETFGYWRGGLEVLTALRALPERLGAWSIVARVEQLVVGDNMAMVNNGGERTEVITTGGVRIVY